MSKESSGLPKDFKGNLPKILLLTAGFFSFGALGGAWGAWQNLCVDCPSIAQISTWEPEQTSKILGHDGRLVAEIGIERRTWVGLGDLPEFVSEAFVALEDRRFYSHHGFDLRGIARSAVRVLVNRSFSGGGGSTISQQLARNMFEERIGREKRIARKLKELQVALALENTYSKAQILEAYINQINYDRGWYGIQTASRNYFGKNASEVNPAEAALLAAIPNRPAYYNPFRNPENALGRRNLALNLMVRQGFLSEEEGEKWKAWPLPEAQGEMREGLAPYFQEWVRQTLDDRFGDQLYTGGLIVHTTLDLDIQAAAERSMEEGWAEYRRAARIQASSLRRVRGSDRTLRGRGDPLPSGSPDRPGSPVRRSQGNGGRKGFPAFQVQPGHPSSPAGRVIFQALRLYGGDSQRDTGVPYPRGCSGCPSSGDRGGMETAEFH